ncbi:MAG TPA: hypothetical protein VFQ38_24795 [Longimicrobiales bacterium]|nr:hypothetical protein [Longimicrobiales bacterium]
MDSSLKSAVPSCRARASRRRAPFSPLVIGAGLVALAGCATTQASSAAAGGGAATTAAAKSSPAAAPKVRSFVSAEAPTPDPRVGLNAGLFDAAAAQWNLALVSSTPSTAGFTDREGPSGLEYANSDLAFTGHYVVQGNFQGFQIWDVADPMHPKLAVGQVCVGSQSDVSVYKNLLFESEESLNTRLDCSAQGVADTVSAARFRGVRIWDISDIAHPKPVAQVQTCRGSHTHTLVTSPSDPSNVYVYVSGSAPVRSPNELAGCSGLAPSDDPNSELFRIEVIQVPLAHPEQARVITKPAILADLGPSERHGELPADVAARERQMAAAGRQPRSRPAGPRTGPVQCHDITVYPAVGLAGGACAGYGLLLDIRDPANPKRVFAAADSNFSFWHSATFTNDGSKVLFSDEWGGGTQPRCRATDKPEWGADAIFTRDGDRLRFQGYYKLPAAQTSTENCVAHNGSLLPVPGRDVMVQAWYQGGISVFDWTDPAHPKEIAYFDRGPVDAAKLDPAGSWSAYWYNGYIYSSEIARGLDVFELKPNPLLTQNEIDAAKLVHFDELNVQDQPQLVWPASFVVARAYVDQLERSHGLDAARIAAVRSALASAEKASGSERASALTALATQLDSDAQGSSDAAKVRLLAGEARRIAGT